MILSIKDAKEKRCPMGGTVFPGRNAVDKCIGPDCMMWRVWSPLPEASSDEDISVTAGNRREWPGIDERGYCGLPGSKEFSFP
jgi:hypothetical protein